jgi:hypothetical protein
MKLSLTPDGCTVLEPIKESDLLPKPEDAKVVALPGR